MGIAASSARLTRPRGMILFYTAVAMAALLGFTSLAVDLGRVQTAKTELERVAAAAARAAVEGLPSVTQAQTNASNIGALNSVDGSAVTIDTTNDITFGTWNTQTRTFTTLTGAARSNANAIQVTCSRTKAKGNGVPLLFASAIGISTCNVTGTATAHIVNGWAAVGSTSVTMSSSAFTDSYNSSNGTYNAAKANHFGSIASNGNITLNNTAVVKGDARPGIAKAVTLNQTSSVTGATGPLYSAISNAAVTIPSSGVTNLGDITVSSGTYSLPGGVYEVNNCTLNGSAVFQLTAPTVVYVTGALTISGGVTFDIYQNLPTNFQVKVSGAGAVNLAETNAFYADLYAPQSDVTYTGDADFYGRIVGQTVTFTGHGGYGLHYDESLGGTTGTDVVLVK